MAIDINIPSQVKNYANLSAFPATGSLKTIFIAEDTNKTYRWTGSAYVEISASQATAWGAITGTLSSQTDLQNALNAKVTSNTAITGATKTKVTYDSKGLITAGADATTADIADSTNKRYVTDANLTVIGNTSGTNTGDQTLAGLGGVPTTRTLTINGTTQDLSADRTFTISTGITIGTTAITSGTVGRVLFEGTGNVVQESANLFWDNTNGRLGVGTSSPTTIVHINGNTAGTAPSLQIRQQTNTVPTWFAVRNTDTLGSAGAISLDIGISGGANQFFNGAAQGDIILKAYSQGNTSKFFLGATSGSAAQMVLFPSTGNVGVNTTTDAGYKLDVNGTARVSGTLTVASTALLGLSLIRTGTSGVAQQIYNSNSITYFGADSLAGGSLFTGGLPYASFFGSGANYPTQFASNNAVRMTIFAGGNVAINTTTDVASAQLQVSSTTQGFLPPRMTTTQKNAIATPATGLMVYDTTLNLISVYNGTTWITL